MKALVVALALGLFGAGGVAPKTVYIRHHDPGCHWYLSGHKLVQSLSLSGPVRLVNQDVEPQTVLTPSGKVIHLKVGGSVVLREKGMYVERMHNQAADDNTDFLTLR